MESQPQNTEFRINPENFHPCVCDNYLNLVFWPMYLRDVSIFFLSKLVENSIRSATILTLSC